MAQYDEWLAYCAAQRRKPMAQWLAQDAGERARVREEQRTLAEVELNQGAAIEFLFQHERPFKLPIFLLYFPS